MLLFFVCLIFFFFFYDDGFLFVGLKRCGKSCRLRWTNYLRPNVKRGAFIEHKEKLIVELHHVLGNRWPTIDFT